MASKHSRHRTFVRWLIPLALVIVAGAVFALTPAALGAEENAAGASSDAASASNVHPYGWLSLAPPLVAIFLAIATRRVVPSLLVGVLTSALVLSRGDASVGFFSSAWNFLFDSLVDHDHLYVFGFTSVMGAMVGVIQRAGGMHGLVEKIIPWANSRRRAQTAGWFMGLAVFFDDYANSLLLGATLQPLTDRLKVSREKLAYIVDSTAAPVAGLALISTWVAGEIGNIADGLAKIGPAADEFDAFTIFIATLPYRFYILWALLFVPLVAWLSRDFGPMLTAERRALGGEIGAVSAASAALESRLAPSDSAPRRWRDAVVPIVTVIAGVIVVLFYTGYRSIAAEGGTLTLWNLIGHGDSYVALLYGSIAGLLTAVVMASIQGGLRPWATIESAWLGARLMLPALVILWLAWSLSASTGPPSVARAGLATADYLGGLLESAVSLPLLPTSVFILAGAVAFATGTSWGTMAILMPLVVDLTYKLLVARGSVPEPDDPIFLGTIGSVLAGAIFGDHCSPISDTTVLSSRASGCDHIAHVRTQMPYALLVAAVSILCGTLPVGYGWPLWPLMLLGPASLVGCLYLFGRRVGDIEA